MGAKINNILYGLWTGCVVYKVTQNFYKRWSDLKVMFKYIHSLSLFKLLSHTKKILKNPPTHSHC